MNFLTGFRETRIYRSWFRNGSIIAECKWTNLDQEEKKRLLEELKKKFERTKLAKTLPRVQFRIFSKEDLQKFGSLKTYEE